MSDKLSVETLVDVLMSISKLKKAAETAQRQLVFSEAISAQRLEIIDLCTDKLVAANKQQQYWEGRFAVVKHENNQLRKRLEGRPDTEFVQKLLKSSVASATRAANRSARVAVESLVRHLVDQLSAPGSVVIGIEKMLDDAFGPMPDFSQPVWSSDDL